MGLSCHYMSYPWDALKAVCDECRTCREDSHWLRQGLANDEGSIVFGMPWSTVREHAAQAAVVAPRLGPATQSSLSRVMEAFHNDDAATYFDVDPITPYDPEFIYTVMNPDHVREIVEELDQLDMTSIGLASQACELPAADFMEFLEQLEALVRYAAAENRAVIVFRG